MGISIFLAKIIGPLLIIIAFSLIINTKDFKNIIKKFGDNSLLVYLSGLITYIIGALILLKHNIWEPSGFVLITIIGYISLLKGASLLLFPKFLLKIIKKFKISGSLLKTFGLLYIVLGVYISYLGFFS